MIFEKKIGKKRIFQNSRGGPSDSRFHSPRLTQLASPTLSTLCETSRHFLHETSQRPTDKQSVGKTGKEARFL